MVSGSLTNDLLEDCGVMLDCPRFIHSNSTLCWFMSFCSQKKKERFIPQTHFYGGQKLGLLNGVTEYTMLIH